MPRGDCKGEARAKITGKGLTEEDVQAIRALPGPLHCIGEQFGISAAMVCMIRKRRKWASVP